MKKLFKRFFIVFLAVIATLCLASCDKKATSAGEIEVTVSTTEVLCSKTIEFNTGDSLVSILQADKDVKLAGSVDDYGFFISGVCGIDASDVGETYYWKVLVNGEPSSVGISFIELVDGIKVSFELVDWTTEAW